MNSKRTPKTQRTYRQTARAKSAAATGRTIARSFVKRLQDQWFEDITLDAVAKDSGVTVQTVIRRFGGKSGLLEAAAAEIGEEVGVRRPVRAGDVTFTIDALTNDYEVAADLILRLLAQEDMHPELKPFLDTGRRGHRDWLATVFAETLEPLTPARRKATLDSLVVATDIYIWKLVRRDMGRPVATFKAIATGMLTAALGAD